MDASDRYRLEPGLLAVFRLYAGVRLALLGLSFLIKFVPSVQRVLRYPLLGMIESALLLVYLSWPWLRKQLGRTYLPIALVVASTAPIVEHSITVGLRLYTGIRGSDAGSDAWQLYLTLFVPLLLIAWQYRFWVVLAFCGGTALLELVLAVPLAARGGPPWLMVLALVFVRCLLFILVGVLVVRLMEGQRAQREALSQANARLARYASTLEQLAVSRERNRLARELHDTLAHSLSAVAVQLEAVNALWESEPLQARTMLEQSLTTTRQGLDEARRAIRALRSAPLEDLGLVLAVANLAEAVATRAGLELELRVPEGVEGLAPAVEQAFYRVAEEALANVVRHAQAHHIALRLEQSGPRLSLTVSDDGRGFNPSDVVLEGHYGLRGIRERAEMVGGKLEILSRPGQGTMLRFSVEDAVDPSTDL
jgi:signal transduction histidine kinase